MTWGMVAVAAATVVKGVMDSNSAKKAGDAQQSAADAALGEQQRQFDLMRGDLMPYMTAGQGGLTGLSALAGGDYSGFQNSPDYLYARDQMIGNLDASAASRGRLNAGGYGVELMQHSNGLASQNLGNYRNSLQYLAGLGQASAAGVGMAGMGMANQNSDTLRYAGNAAAQSHINQSNAFGSMMGGLGSLAGQYFGMGGGGGGGGSFGGPTDAMQQVGAGGAWG